MGKEAVRLLDAAYEQHTCWPDTAPAAAACSLQSLDCPLLQAGCLQGCLRGGGSMLARLQQELVKSTADK